MASFAVMVLIETNDPVLIAHDAGMVKAAATLRRLCDSNIIFQKI